jgi:electron transport complex protein RnfC
VKPREIQIARPDWGIAFPRPTVEAGGLPLKVLALPDELLVPLQQQAGRVATPLVSVGDQVTRYQPIATGLENGLQSRIHAPTSGKVTAIELHAAPGLTEVLCVRIESDHQDRIWEPDAARLAAADASADELRSAIAAAGIVGLGGALFPTSVKLDPDKQIATLILNGVECEPRINCDDALIQKRPDAILQGAQIMLKILRADNCVVALKSDAEPALRAMRNALRNLDDDRFELALVPPVYPAGGESQLVQLLSGTEVPSGGLPWDAGFLCQNVATAAAIADCINNGVPLTTRIVTVTGSGVKEPVNIEARIGTSLSELINFAGGYAAEAVQLCMGGPMMGIALESDRLPVTKACNCIYVQSVETLTRPATELPCIRCGDCADVCPVNLAPQMMLAAERTSDFERLGQLGLKDCIECGCCDYVCPSNIPLTHKFASTKRAQRQLEFERQRARKAEQRFSARETREERRKMRINQELDAQTTELDSAAADSKAALQELLARVNKRGREDQK